MPVTHEVASSSLVGPAIYIASFAPDHFGGEMGSTVSRKLKLQIELSTSINGSKKEKQTSYHSQRKITLPFPFPSPAGGRRTPLRRISPDESAFCSTGSKIFERTAAAVFVCF